MSMLQLNKTYFMVELKLDGKVIGERYQVRGRISSGSYAEVFVARDLQNAGKEVVIKALNTGLQGTPDFDLEQMLLEYFEKEAAILKSISHPNIVALLDKGKAIDASGMEFIFIALEYMQGGDLLRFTRTQKDCRLSLGQTLNYFRQICDGLTHAHEKGIIHRDLKPNNFLLSADHGTIKIADFGVAKIATQEIAEISQVGTDCYSPPEHSPKSIAPTVSVLTASADVYSLAKSCFTVLCSRAPTEFAGLPITSLPSTFQTQTWAKPLLEILQRATQTEVEKRYASVAEFWQDLAHIAIFTRQEIAVSKVKRQTAEEDELNKKRAELLTLESILAQSKLDSATLQAELREFESEYVRRVGALYAELDEIHAKIAEAEAEIQPEDSEAQVRAQEARAQAKESARTVEEEKTKQPSKFKPSATAKRLFHKLAKMIHPDTVLDEDEKLRRHEWMIEATQAYEQGDTARLERLISDWQESPESVKGDGAALELARLIRKIAQAEKRLAEIKSEIEALKNSDLFQLRAKVEEAALEGRDLFDEMAVMVKDLIADAKKRLEDLQRTKIRYE